MYYRVPTAGGAIVTRGRHDGRSGALGQTRLAWDDEGAGVAISSFAFSFACAANTS